MIKYIKQPYEDGEIHKILNPIVSNWFKKKFSQFSLPQKYAVMDIHNKKNVLVSAVTGS